MRALIVAVLACALVVAAVTASEKGTNKDSWADTPTTTNMWRIISGGDVDELKSLLESAPENANVRASDGRGPLWWAYEYGKQEMIAELIKAGAKEAERDADGKTPKEVTSVGPTAYQQELDRQAASAPPPASGPEDDDDDV